MALKSLKSNDLIGNLLNDTLLSKGSHQAIARVLPHVSERSFEAGETVYKAGQEAEYLYLLVGGTIQLVSPQGKSVDVSQGRFGAEAATALTHYISDAVAISPGTALSIPRADLAGLLATNQELESDFYFSLVGTFSGENLEYGRSTPTARDGVGGGQRIEILGWLLTLIVPGVVLYFAPGLQLGSNASVFLAILTATALMWLFNLVDEFVPGVFALLATLALGLAPSSVVLSGFASDGFFMAMSILGLGALIVSSGLSYRFLLVLLVRLPKSQFWYNAGMLLTGFLLTPVVPVTNGRVALIKPFLLDMVETLEFKAQGKAATRLTVAAFSGVTLLSAVVMSSKSSNFVVYGLLPVQLRDQFQWFSWLIAAAVNGSVLLILYLVAVALAFRSDELPRLSRDQVAAQLQLLGKITSGEWAAIGGIALFMVGVVTETYHRVQTPWLGMGILYGLLLLGFLKKNEFRERIDWPLLVYLGSLVGIGATFTYLGIDKWVASHLGVMGESMRTEFGWFILLLSGAILVMRLAVPMSPAIAISATVFMPLAEAYGISPWVIGFIILNLGEMWFFPYQSTQYLQLREATGTERVYSEGAFLWFNGLLNLIKIGCIYASIPYWKAMGWL